MGSFDIYLYMFGMSSRCNFVYTRYITNPLQGIYCNYFDTLCVSHIHATLDTLCLKKPKQQNI